MINIEFGKYNFRLGTFGTYNMGARSNDYELAGGSTEDGKYEEVQARTSEEITSQDIPSVFFLQELGCPMRERPLIKELEKRNYSIVHQGRAEKYVDSGIAINLDEYDCIDDYSTNFPASATDVSVSTARHKTSGFTMSFASAHVPGCDFNSPTKDSAVSGDRFCRELINYLSDFDTDLVVIGADMNINPEGWPNRFDIFTRAGYKLVRTNKPTAINRDDEKNQLRELDYFFIKANNKKNYHPIRSLFKSAFISGVIDAPLCSDNPEVPSDLDKNASDHLPVYMNCSYSPMNFIDAMGSTPFIGSVVSIGRIIASVFAGFVSMFTLIFSAEHSKRIAAWSLQNLSIGLMELIPGVKMIAEYMLHSKNSSVSLRITNTDVTRQALPGEKITLGQHFYSKLQRNDYSYKKLN